MEQQKRWCIFTSAGDHNAIRRWLQGNVPRRWDLIVAYYGDNDHEFAEINKISSNAFRAKGGKFQILKKLMVQNPRCLDQYSHVWVCDDDIRMSAAQINEAFAIAEFFKFWVAHPSFLQEGKIIPRKEQVTSANLHPGRRIFIAKTSEGKPSYLAPCISCGVVPRNTSERLGLQLRGPAASKPPSYNLDIRRS